MTTPIYRYPLDGTGLSPDNLVVGEEHQLSNRAVRCVGPTYGGFFAQGVVVKDLATNLPLIKGVDYSFGELFEFPTGRYGKEVYGLIVITKPNVNAVSITYQALGGNYSYSMDAIIEMVDNLNLGERPTAWGSIVNRPALFDPASHFHDIGDVYGMEYIVHALDRLRSAILTGDVVSHDEIYRYIDRTISSQSGAVGDVGANLARHEADRANPHAVTKAQIGLNLVENYATANQAQMDAGVATNVYVTPAIAYKHVTDRAVTPLTNHIGNTNNPHGTTKAHIGLGNVDNFITATDAIALAGVSTSNFVTPKNVAAVVKRDAIDPINSHVGNTNNPHGTTKAQIGLSSVENYGVANQAQMDAGSATNLYVTPAIVYKHVTDRAVAPLSAHVGRTDNPHGTNKSQIGLGNVDNFATANNATAVVGNSASHFVTPASMKYTIDQIVMAPLVSHINNTSNPHGTNKWHVGLGNVANYEIASTAEAQATTSDNYYMTPYKTRLAMDVTVPAYFNLYRASVEQTRDAGDHTHFITPAGLASIFGINNSNYYTRADVDWLIAHNRATSYTFTYGQDLATYSFSSYPNMMDYSRNYFDVYPPADKTMINLAAFLPSISQIDFAGTLDTNDNLRCRWERQSDRVRVWVFNSEQDHPSKANWMAVWN